jgi:hypothetical protein
MDRLADFLLLKDHPPLDVRFRLSGASRRPYANGLGNCGNEKPARRGIVERVLHGLDTALGGNAVVGFLARIRSLENGRLAALN